MNRYEYMNDLFDAIHHGLSSNEAYRFAALRRRERGRNYWGQERGDLAEQNVFNALMDHPQIDSLERSQPFDKRDRAGIDIHVILKGCPDRPFSDVDIQVKASMTQIRKFMSEARRRQRLGNNYAVAEWMLQRRLMLIRGLNSPQSIVGVFDKQLDHITHYHRQHQIFPNS